MTCQILHYFQMQERHVYIARILASSDITLVIVTLQEIVIEESLDDFVYPVGRVPVTEKVSLIRLNIVWNQWKSTLTGRSTRVNMNHRMEM